MINTITIKRVVFAKKETLPQNREYNLIEGGRRLSSVGTLSEITDFMQGRVKKIRIIDELMEEDYIIKL